MFRRQIYNKKFRSSVFLCLLLSFCEDDIFVFDLAFGYFFCLFDLAILLVRRFVSFVFFYEVVVLIVLHRMCVFHAIELPLNMVKCKGNIFG